ncbi:MAG: hypothetical protein IKK33_11025 [Lachnospiraceae bacterium]|nr:hypothetical protein [Lachnospiraceae bacterium]
MRKRFLALLLSGMLLGLSACGNTDTEESKEAGGIATEESKEATISTQEAPEATQAPIVGAEESGEETASTEEMPEASKEEIPEEIPVQIPDVALSVEMEDIYDYYYEPETHYLLMNGNYDSIFINNAEYSALADAISSFQAKQAERYEKLKEKADADFKEYGKEHFAIPYKYESKLIPSRADELVLSVLERDYIYEGEGNESYCFESINLDVKSGKEIPLSDIVTDVSQLSGILENELEDTYLNVEYDSVALNSLVQASVQPTGNDGEKGLAWTLGYKGLSVHFTGEDIGWTTKDTLQITIPYSEYPQFFVSDYVNYLPKDSFVEPEGDYIHLLTDGMDFKNVSVVDLYGDGTEDYIQIAPYSADEYRINMNDHTFLLDSFYFGEAYLVKNDDSYYLYLQMYYDNDIRTIEMFVISPDSIMYLGKRGGELENFTDPKHFVIRDYMNMLMSKHVEADCYIGTNGEPALSKGVYNIEPREDERTYDYISRVDIPAELVDEQGNQLGTTYTFPSGTEFTLIRTDGETYVDAKTGDGKYCRLYTEPAGECDYHPTVNGLDAETCFGILGFAG